MTSSTSTQTVVICQGKACRKGGAAQVLCTLQAALQDHPLPDLSIATQSCFGQCGNGPMVLVLPEQVWYCRVRCDEVSTIVHRHLEQGQPIEAMLYRKFHPNSPSSP